MKSNLPSELWTYTHCPICNSTIPKAYKVKCEQFFEEEQYRLREKEHKIGILDRLGSFFMAVGISLLTPEGRKGRGHM